MRTSLKYLSMIGATASLMACADTNQHIVPVSESPSAPSFADADQAYLIGRGHHLAQRFDAAATAYQAALKIAPQHVNARNGLATMYAEQGRFDMAIALWKTLTTATFEQAAPKDGFLFSNLGYAMFLSGDYDGALSALQKACMLDPLNHRAWQHMGDALEKLGQHDKAAAMHRQAAALKAHDFRADYAVARSAGTVSTTVLDTAMAAADGASADWDETQVQKTVDGMFVMHRIPARRKHAAITPSAIAPPSLPSVLQPVVMGNAQLEISNGNGVTGMARALSKTLTNHEWHVVRLTNQKGFGVSDTRVEYQPEFRDAAERLAARFGAAKAVPVSDVRRADMRLIIGHDIVKSNKVRGASAATVRPNYQG